MAVGIVTHLKTVFETEEGRVDVVRAGGYTFKVIHGKVERANRAEELRVLDAAKSPVLRRLRSGVAIRGSQAISGERPSVYIEGTDEDGSYHVSADEMGNISLSLPDLDLNVSYSQYLALKRLFSGSTLDRLLDAAQAWCRAG